MAFRKLFVAASLVALAACDSDSGGGGGKVPPLNPVQKTETQQSMTAYEIGERALELLIEGKTTTDANVLRLLLLLRNCEVNVVQAGDQLNGSQTTTVDGEACPIVYKSVVSWKAHMEGDTLVIDSNTSTSDYSTSDANVLAIVDFTSVKTSMSMNGSRSSPVEVLAVYFEIQSVKHGLIKGKDFLALKPAGENRAEFTFGRDLTFPNYVVKARAVAMISNLDQEEPTVESVVLSVNGEEVTLDDFKKYFPIFDEEEQLQGFGAESYGAARMSLSFNTPSL